MKLPVDVLLEALTHPSLYLSGDENGGVGLHCHTHHDGGRPLAYYDRAGDTHPDPLVANAPTIPTLWAEAAGHLEAQHRERQES